MVIDTGAVVAIISLMLGIAAGFARIIYQMGSLELKVNTIWDFLIRRGQVEFVNKGWGTKNSPVKLTTAIFESILPLISDIVKFYAELIKNKPNITERDLFIAIESQFGDALVERICVPMNVQLGACVIAVMEACRIATESQKNGK
jgi:hypothetical protein